ncbi:hypothetical protein AURDEDRAFT_132101, partial [Auricularia subglabra TFB-10046 SS5]
MALKMRSRSSAMLSTTSHALLGTTGDDITGGAGDVSHRPELDGETKGKRHAVSPDCAALLRQGYRGSHQQQHPSRDGVPGHISARERVCPTNATSGTRPGPAPKEQPFLCEYSLFHRNSPLVNPPAMQRDIAAEVARGRAAQPSTYGVMFSGDLAYQIASWIINDGQVQVLVSKPYDINLDLGAWFDQVLLFRRLHAQLRLYLSGSFALNAFRKANEQGVTTVDESSDLDIFVDWEDVHHLVWFVKAEGYVLVTCYDNFQPPANAPP